MDGTLRPDLARGPDFADPCITPRKWCQYGGVEAAAVAAWLTDYIPSLM